MDEAEFNASWTKGRSMTLDQSIEFGLGQEAPVSS
jgi:hypothetical protein